MKEKRSPPGDHWLRQCRDLIHRQKAFVLATSDRNHPWAAPVYYVYQAPAFYFFSSPHSRHVQQAMKNRVISAALYSDADRWEQIEGVQMVGRIEEVGTNPERLKVTANYIRKFPPAGNLLAGKVEGALDLSAKVRLYAFYPERVFYTNNQMGFGSRQELDLS